MHHCGINGLWERWGCFGSRNLVVMEKSAHIAIELVCHTLTTQSYHRWQCVRVVCCVLAVGPSRAVLSLLPSPMSSFDGGWDCFLSGYHNLPQNLWKTPPIDSAVPDPSSSCVSPPMFVFSLPCPSHYRVKSLSPWLWIILFWVCRPGSQVI